MNQWACNYDAPGVEVNNVLNTIWDDNNKRSKVSPIMGFTFNPEPVKTQIASCNAVIEEQFVGFDCGSVELTQNYPRFLEKLKKSGADKIIAEKQKQLEAFLAKK